MKLANHMVHPPVALERIDYQQAGGVLPQVAEDPYPCDQTGWDPDDPA